MYYFATSVINNTGTACSIKFRILKETVVVDHVEISKVRIGVTRNRVMLANLRIFELSELDLNLLSDLMS